MYLGNKFILGSMIDANLAASESSFPYPQLYVSQAFFNSDVFYVKNSSEYYVDAQVRCDTNQACRDTSR